MVNIVEHGHHENYECTIFHDSKAVHENRPKTSPKNYYCFHAWCTSNQIRKATFKYTEAMKLKHNFDTLETTAGRIWFRWFVSRNDICGRMTEFSLLTEPELHSSRRFNETGISLAQDPRKILAPKLQYHRLHNKLERIKEHHLTVCTISAACTHRTYIFQMFIFPRKKMNLGKDGQAGATYKWSIK